MIYPKAIADNPGKYMEITFGKAGGKILCRIHVRRSDVPCYAIATYSETRQIAHFYIRSDSETTEVDFRDTGKYIMKHFCGQI